MHWQFGEMEFGEMKRNTSNWCNFGMLLRRVGLTASAGLSCSVVVRQRCLTSKLAATMLRCFVLVHKRGGIKK